MTDRKFYSGNNLDQALMKASRDLDVAKEELAFKQIEKRHGFLKMRRGVVIEVDPSSPRLALSDEDALAKAQKIEPEVEGAPRRQADWVPSPEEPVSNKEEKAPRQRGMVDLPDGLGPLGEKYPQAEGEVADAMKESLAMLLELGGVDMEASVLQGDGRYEVELWGPDQDLLLKDHGRPLLGLQHLLVRMVRGKTGEMVYCRVDCDRFHDIREERLRDLAQRVASDVASRHHSRLLEAMAPDERRIVHMTLATDPNVETESQGQGFFKRIKVRPV